MVQEPKTITHQKLEPANTDIKHHLEVTYFPTSLIYSIFRLTHNPILLNIENKFLLFHGSSKILINLADPITNVNINSLR
jgi:hypothetical protein